MAAKGQTQSSQDAAGIDYHSRHVTSTRRRRLPVLSPLYNLGSVSLFYSIIEGLMSWLQSVQNAAAHLVSGARRYDHITPVLCRLPVRRRVHFKMATLVYLSLSDMASAYVAANC